MDTEPPDPSYLSIFPLGIVMLGAMELSGMALLLVTLLILSGLISGSEIAFFSLTPNDLETLRSEESSVSRRILKLKEKPRKLLATILISNNFINIAIVIVSEALIWGIFTEAIFLEWARSLHQSLSIGFMTVETIARIINFLIVTVGATFLLVLFGEVAPKIYASLNNMRFAKTMSLPLSLLNRLFSPISHFMVNMTNRIEKKIEQSGSRTTNKDDLHEAIDVAVSGEQDSVEEIDILKGILKFSDVPVKQIMRSRVDVVAIDDSDNFHDVLKVIREKGFSRFPVYKEDKDNITGILHVKDILAHLDAGKEFEWQELINGNVLYVPEYKMINDLLKEFQLKRSHMAIVVDEYGGSEGMVTLEDVMEEVIGEIKDEVHDFEDIEYTQIDDFNYIFEGKTMLNDVSRIIGKDTTTFDEVRGDADSIAGLILEITGSIPKIGKEVHFDSMKFRIEKVDKRRIKEIKLTLEKNEE